MTTKKQPARTPAAQPAAAIDERDLDQVSAGIGLLLPAVQKVREAAAR